MSFLWRDLHISIQNLDLDADSNKIPQVMDSSTKEQVSRSTQTVMFYVHQDQRCTILLCFWPIQAQLKIRQQSVIQRSNNFISRNQNQQLWSDLVLELMRRSISCIPFSALIKNRDLDLATVITWTWATNHNLHREQCFDNRNKWSMRIWRLVQIASCK